MIIKIGTDRFWVRASNLERWAELLSSLPEKILSKSKKDMAKDYLYYKVDEEGRIIHADEVYGLFGVEKVKSSLTIVGCNFIKRNEEGYVLTEGAVKLLNQYKNHEKWEKTLAEQLLKYSLRVRTLALALLNGGTMCFEKGYMKDFITTSIHYENKKYYVFSSKPQEVNINHLLNTYPSKVLGPYWREELDLLEGEEIKFQGINKEEPSLGSMSTYLKIPMMLFDYLGWMKEGEEGKYTFDKQRMRKDIDARVFESLILDDVLNEIEVLKALILNHSDARGFFPLELVGCLLNDKLDRENDRNDDQWIDHYFITGIHKGLFKILDHEQGQPRHGRGLFGKKDYQLIKLEIIN